MTRWVLLSLVVHCAAPAMAAQRPCDIPMAPHVAEIDGRFGFTRAQVERALSEAAAMWQDHAREPLFAPDARRRVPVNLRYGPQQQRAEHARSLRAQLDARAKVLDERRDAHRRLEARIATERAAYHREADALGPRSLDSDRQRVERMRLQLNASVEEFNRLVGILNREVNEYNALVARYNRAAATTAEQAGQYTFSTRAGARIDIFRAIDHQSLVAIIAHELGHALGIGHVDEAGAVMSAAMGVERPRRLARADVAALRRACG